MNVVVTGGGTGGHIYPALAVAEALERDIEGIRIEYIGATTGRERDIAAHHGLPFTGVPARRIRKVASPDTLVSLFALYRGYRQARARMRAIKPSVVLGTGGYVAAAATLAASSLGVPTVIHEQNAVAGRTNRWLAKRVQTVCVTYECSAQEFAGSRVVVTGLPLRSVLVSRTDRGEARWQFGIAENAFCLLVLGGSQGAMALNHAVLGALRGLDAGVAVIHQTGPGNEGSAPEGIQCRYIPVAYLDTRDLSAAYAAADLTLCRCGASTLAEVAVAGLPALLVPYPLAYADHQTANARAVAESGAGVLIPQSSLSSERLLEEVARLRKDRDALSAMAAASGRLARPEAARAVADEMLQCAAEGRDGQKGAA